MATCLIVFLFDPFVINYLGKLSWSTTAWTIQPDWKIQFSPESVENKLKMPAKARNQKFWCTLKFLNICSIYLFKFLTTKNSVA